MVFVDIGCGDGFFSILAAKKVGANGKVYAVDIDASAIEKLKQKAKAEGLITSPPKSAKLKTQFSASNAPISFSTVWTCMISMTQQKCFRTLKQMIKPNGQTN